MDIAETCYNKSGIINNLVLKIKITIFAARSRVTPNPNVFSNTPPPTNTFICDPQTLVSSHSTHSTYNSFDPNRFKKLKTPPNYTKSYSKKPPQPNLSKVQGKKFYLYIEGFKSRGDTWDKHQDHKHFRCCRRMTEVTEAEFKKYCKYHPFS